MNPEGVVTLADLALEGLEVGVLARESGELGTFIWAALDEAGVADALSGSTGLTTNVDPLPLVEAVRRKQLDVALVYGTQAGAPTMRNDVNPLLHPQFELRQSLALRANQAFPELAGRLRDSLRNPDVHETFFHLGYRWQPRADSQDPQR